MMKAIFLSKTYLSGKHYRGIPTDLMDNITTDHITTIPDVLMIEPEGLRASLFGGLKEWGNRELESGKRRVLVAGESFGIGSSRENSAEAIKLNGFEYVVAKSFGPIFQQNLINQGVFPVTDFEVLEMLKEGEEVPFERLTAGLSHVQKRILLAGGLPRYIQAVAERKEDLPQDLLPERPERPQTVVEKMTTRFNELVHKELGDRSKPIHLYQGDSAVLQAEAFVGYDVFWAHAWRVLTNYFGETLSVDPKNIYLFADHFGGLNDQNAKEAIRLLTHFWRTHPESFMGSDGVYNKVMPRKLKFGSLVIGMDSHTPELGITPGVLPVPVGYTAFAGAVANKGLFPYTIPETIQLELTGRLPGYCEIKDALWDLTGKYFSGSLGNGKMVEIGGGGYQDLSFEEAAKVFNTVTEFGGIGAVSGVYLPSIERYLRRHGEQKWEGVLEEWYRQITPDEGAEYAASITFDLGATEPSIVGPHSHKKVQYLSELTEPITLDRVIYNSCSGSSTLDLAVLASVLSDEPRTIPVDVHLADPLTRYQAEKLGILYDLAQSQVVIDDTHACGPCMGQGAKVTKNERVLSTNNRNYPGRMGDESGEVYLASSVVAALTAKLGRVPTIEEVKAAEPLVFAAREKVGELA